MKRLLRVAAVFSMALLVATPALAEVSQNDVDRAAQQLEELRQKSDALVAQYEEAWASSELLQDHVRSLTDLVAGSQVDIGVAQQKVQDRAVEMYMNGTGGEMFTAFLLSGGSGAGIGYLEETAAADQQLVNDLASLRTSYERQLDDLEAAQAEQDRVTADMQSLADQLLAQMSSAQAAYDVLKEARARQLAEEEAARKAAEEEAARQAAATSTTTTAAAPSTTAEAGTTSTTSAAETTTTQSTTTTTVPLPSGSQVCPIDGFTTFSDTWGAPRSGGRTHEGVDMMAERWTHVVAIESGTIYQLKVGGLGGRTIWLHSDSGDSYYYAHLEAWADGLHEDQRVEAGELIGYVGTSGNAPDWLPHLHFEFHPDHGAAVDPYPLVKSLCG